MQTTTALQTATAARLLSTAHDSSVSFEDLDAILALAKRLHPNHERFADLDQIFARWHTRNDEIFQFVSAVDQSLSDGNQRIGYTCVIPLSEKAYLDYEAGLLSEWKIGLRDEDILSSPIETNCRYILIQSIELEEKYRNQHKFDEAVLHTLLRHFSKFNARPDQVKPIFIADGNKLGEAMLQRRGFQKIAEVGDAADPRPLFRLDFSESNPTARRLDTRQALTRYMKAYGQTTKLALIDGAVPCAVVPDDSAEKKVPILHLKPTLWGVGIDLVELYRFVRRKWPRSK